MTPQVTGLFKALDAMEKAEPGTPLRGALQMQRLADALRGMVTAANVKEIDPLVMFVSIERARAALADYDEASYA